MAAAALAACDGAPGSEPGEDASPDTSADTDSGTTASIADVDIATTPTLTVDEVPPADVFISDTGSDSTGDGSEGNPYATLGTGASNAEPGEIIEAQADGTGTWTHAPYTTITRDGISGSPIRFRARPGDTFNMHPSSRGTQALHLDGSSFWRFDGSLGEVNVSDPSHWVSTGGGSSSAYPNNSGLRIDNARDVEIGNVDLGGGRAYNANLIRDSSNIHLHDLTVTGHGTVSSSSRWGNGLDIQSSAHVRFEDIRFLAPAGGHNAFELTSTDTALARRLFFDLDWDALTGNGEGYRAAEFGSSAFTDTPSPMLVEQSAFRDVDENSGYQTVRYKLQGRRLIFRYNYVLDSSAPGADSITTFGIQADGAVEHIRIYHNTYHNNANIQRLHSFGATDAKENLSDIRRYNNIESAVTATTSAANSFPHRDRIISQWIEDDTSDPEGLNLQGCPDYWLCAVWVGNMIDADSFKAFVSPTTGGSSGTEVTSLASAISTWPDVFLPSNNTNAPTFVDVAAARAATTIGGVANGLQLTAGSNGRNEAVPMAEITSGSTGTTLTMDDAYWIYDGFVNGDEHNRDYIAVFADGDTCAGTPKGIRRIVAKSVTATTVKVEESLSVAANDPVYPVLPDGTTVVCNVGANQR